MPTKNPGAPVGQRIREACAILERLGSVSASELCEHMDDIEASNMGKYCSRAVGLGLMTVKRGVDGKRPYAIFTVVPNWREVADLRRTTAGKTAQPAAFRPSRWQGVASVFQIGAQI